MAATPVARRRQPPPPEVLDAELLDLAEQIRLGVRVDARTAVESMAAQADVLGQPAAPASKNGNYHLKPATTHLYRPLGEGHGDRRPVPVANVPMLIKSGWTIHCPFCGKRNCTQELNTCEGMEKKQFTRCPVCSKRIQDEIEGEYSARDPEAESEEFEIEIVPNLTPTQRIRNRLAIHMRTFHPQAALQYGFVRVPNAPETRNDAPLRGGDLA